MSNDRTISYYYKFDGEKSSKMVAEIVTATHRSISTVYMWMRMERQPCFLEKKLIQSKVMKYYGDNVSLEELFGKQS